MTDIAKINDVGFGQALRERYLSYAMSTIVSRSLPNVRDGLKPVHRRILYAMWETGNTSDKPYKKSASAVGYVMMKYHPHGDTAIYDSMVRMSQEFSMRYPLIEGQGNFGSIDGDSAAAMRYTEARLTPASQLMLEGLKEDAVDFAPTYNGQSHEPLVLPSKFPNILANGATGIAVGMATNIPPHNVDEICQALCRLIKNPELTNDDLLQSVKGPDFPTGGLVVETPETIANVYKTGRGSLTLRARWQKEDRKRGHYQIVVTELPFQVQKSRLIEKIADAMQKKKLPFLQDIRDESTADIRLILEPKTQNIDPEMLMESVFKQSDLETRFPVNLNVIQADQTPSVLDLKQILQAHIDHRHKVLIRRTEHRRHQILTRLEVLDGLFIVYLNLDEVIRIIRHTDDPKSELQHHFDLTDVQVDAILNTKLRALRKLEEMQIRNEHTALKEELSLLEDLLGHAPKQIEALYNEFKGIQKQFSQKTAFGARRTQFALPSKIEILPVTAMIEKEPMTVSCSMNGWLRGFKGHLDKDIKYKEGDQERFILHAQTTDTILFVSKAGRVYSMLANDLPSGRGLGDPIQSIFDIERMEDVTTLLISTEDSLQTRYLFVSSDGRGFQVQEHDLISRARQGKQVMSLPKGQCVRACVPVDGDTVAIVGENRKLLIFPLSEIIELPKGRGLKLQNYRDGGTADAITFHADQGLPWQFGKSTKQIQDLTLWEGKRGQAGRLAPRGRMVT